MLRSIEIHSRVILGSGSLVKVTVTLGRTQSLILDDGGADSTLSAQYKLSS